MLAGSIAVTRNSPTRLPITTDLPFTMAEGRCGLKKMAFNLSAAGFGGSAATEGVAGVSGAGAGGAGVTTGAGGGVGSALATAGAGTEVVGAGLGAAGNDCGFGDENCQTTTTARAITTRMDAGSS